jgi:hypothetical protein
MALVREIHAHHPAARVELRQSDHDQTASASDVQDPDSSLKGIGQARHEWRSKGNTKSVRVQPKGDFGERQVERPSSDLASSRRQNVVSGLFQGVLQAGLAGGTVSGPGGGAAAID